VLHEAIAATAVTTSKGMESERLRITNLLGRGAEFRRKYYKNEAGPE